MPEPLKNIYSPHFFEQLTASIKSVIPSFNQQYFLNQVFDRHWPNKELKQRVRHIAESLNEHLPGNFKQQARLVLKIIEQLKKEGKKGGFEYMIFPDWIEAHGLQDLETSLNTMEKVTEFISCEFAIRPFLLKYPDEVINRMIALSKHPHPHVRRFSSEGCRPRLPWGQAISSLKKDPTPVLPILENLKSDPSLFVRKSVANHLNDISKDHPDFVIRLVKKWKGKNPETDWIIRHGCRGLLKKAHTDAYALFDLKNGADCRIEHFSLQQKKIAIGGKLMFSFQLVNTGKKETSLRLEYKVHYRKAGGQSSGKIFQLSEKKFLPGQAYSFKKQQSFQDFTTRKHYPGKHQISLLVNGKEMANEEFMLTS